MTKTICLLLLSTLFIVRMTFAQSIDILKKGVESEASNQRPKIIDEGTWYPIDMNNKNTGSFYVDWSGLLDAPAGKHGFLKVVDGAFQFEDGTPIVFNGVNVTAGTNFLEKSEADSLAKRFSKMGCNMVRLHMLDAAWSIPNVFGNSESTRELNPAAMDKLDFFISRLKKRGIYVFMDVLVHRVFSPEDGVKEKLPEPGGKSIAFFDPIIIDLQKQFAKQLMEHKNRYTGLSYKDDPVIVAAEFINESSAFMYFEGDVVSKSPYYQKQLEELFKKAGYTGKLASFKMEFSSNSRIVNTRPGADVEGSIKFLSSIEESYYKDMYTFYRSLGVKFPLAGSNFPFPILADLKQQSKMDFTISNTYWDHPQVWNINNDWSRVMYAPLENTSQLTSPFNNTIKNMAPFRVKGKPFIVTEWNHCYPNEFQSEGAPFMTAYAKLQGWGGLCQYTFDKPHLPGAEKLATAFDISKMLEHLAQWVVTSPMLLRNDIKTAPGLVVNSIKKEQWEGLPNVSDFINGQRKHLPFVTKVAYSYEGNDADNTADFSRYYNAKENIAVSETGELTLDMNKGIMKVNTDKIQGAVGNIKNLSMDFPVGSFNVKNSFCSLFFVSKDGKPLSQSSSFYIVAVTATKLTGQKFNAKRNALVDLGELPLLAQTLNGEVTFKNIKTATIQPIEISGKVLPALNTTISGTDLKVNLSEGKSFVFEVNIKR